MYVCMYIVEYAAIWACHPTMHERYKKTYVHICMCACMKYWVSSQDVWALNSTRQPVAVGRALVGKGIDETHEFCDMCIYLIYIHTICRACMCIHVSTIIYIQYKITEKKKHAFNQNLCCLCAWNVLCYIFNKNISS